MTNKFKKITGLFFTFISSFMFVSCNNNNNQNTGYDGKTFDISINQDESVIASINKVGSNFELTISGQGEALSYSEKGLVPWNAISKKISKVNIEEGISNIGNYYFYSTTLDYYYIPSSVTTIEENSFNSNAVIYSYAATPITTHCDNDIYYYSESSPEVGGLYWHLVGESPVVWENYKLMFIGNSFTFYPNDVFSVDNPGVCYLTKEIAKDLGLSLEIDFVVKGAHSLLKFSNEKDEYGKIVHEKLHSASDYDYIILQEQSTTPIETYTSFENGVKNLLTKINQTQEDCKVVLYSTWGFPSGLNSKYTTVAAMEKAIRDAYITCAEDNDLMISHVGKAFTEVYENYPNISIYSSKDNKHQSYEGAYLSACVHLVTLFGIDVRSSKFTGDLDKETADTLQDVAYDIVINKGNN